MTSQLIERIKKLLSLAQSDNANERDAALAKAQALATEHQIDMALIDRTTCGVIQEEKFEKDLCEIGRRRTAKIRFISWLLQSHFNVSVVWSGSTIVFVGRTSDVQFAKWLFSYFQEEFARRWNEYKLGELTEQGISDARPYLNTFLYGCYQGLDSKLDEEREAAKAQHLETRAVAQDAAHVSAIREDLGNRYALVVREEKDKRDEALKDFFPRLSSGRGYHGVRIRNHGTFSAGERAGRSISTNRPLN